MATIDVAAPTGGNDQTLLQNAINNAAANDVLVFPAGSTYLHNAKIVVQNKAGLTFRAAGNDQFTWQATTPTAAAFHIWTAAHATKVIGLKHRVVGATTRIDNAFNVAPFVVDYANGVELTDCISEGSAGLGYYLFNAHNGVYTRPQVQGSLADGFHMTWGTSYTSVVDAFINNAGDDGIAQIGYLNDGQVGRPHHNTLTRPVVHDSRARGLSFIGCYDSTATAVDIDGTLAASVMFACERGDFNTSITERCTVTGGRISRSNTGYAAIPGGTNGTALNHGALCWTAATSAAYVTDCDVANVAVGSFGAAAENVARVLNYSGNITGCGFTGVTVHSGSPSAVVGGTAPSLLAPQAFTESRSTAVPATAAGPVGTGGGTAPAPSTTVTDAFTRTSTSTPGTADTGQAWRADKGTWGTDGARLYSVTKADDDQVTVDVSTADQHLSARVYGGAVANRFPELLARWSSTGTYYQAEVTPAGAITLRSRRSGGYTSVYATSAAVWSDGAVLGLDAVDVTGGVKLTAYVGGTEVLTYTDTAAARPSGTRAGFRHGASTNGQAFTFDDFTAGDQAPPTSGTPTWSWWNGTAEEPLTLAREWNGTTTTALTASIT